MKGEHDYITVGARRWCRNCNTFQRFRSGKWSDDPDMIGAWPGYSRTDPQCPKAPDDEPSGDDYADRAEWKARL